MPSLKAFQGMDTSGRPGVPGSDPNIHLTSGNPDDYTGPIKNAGDPSAGVPGVKNSGVGADNVSSGISGATRFDTSGGIVGNALAGIPNPFKGGVGGPNPNIQDAQQVAAPVNPFTGAPQVSAPAPFQGAKIGNIADPRQALINQAQQNQFRGQQQDLAARLAATASGQGPMVSDVAARQAQAANQAATFAQLNSTRGAVNPLMARNTMNTAANLGLQGQEQAQIARMQEAQAAQGQLANVLNQGRGQDIGLATAQAQLDQGNSLAKYQGDLQKAVQQGQLDQQTASQVYAVQAAVQQQQAALDNSYQDRVAQYAQMGMTAAEANQKAAIDIQSLKAKVASDAKARNNQLLGGGLSAAASAAPTLLKMFGSSGSTAAPAEDFSGIGDGASSATGIAGTAQTIA